MGRNRRIETDFARRIRAKRRVRGRDDTPCRDLRADRGASARSREFAARERSAASREREAACGERRASPAIGSGQFDELQAAVERRAAEEAARSRQPSRPVGQGERRAARAQGRYAAAGGDARPDCPARSGDVPPLPGGARSFDADRRGGAPGLRSARAADRGDGAPGRDLRLRPLPLRDAGGVPGRGERAGAIWRAPASGGGLSQRPATHSRGPGRPDALRPVRRCPLLPGH